MKSIIFFLAIGLGIGFLVSAQLKAPRDRILNPIEPFSSLGEVRDNLVQKSDSLKQTIKDKRAANDALQNQIATSKKTSESDITKLNFLKEKVGLTEIKDKGVVITLADSIKVKLTTDSIVHAADLRDVVNALWQAGAKSISINDERLVLTTSIDSATNPVLINNSRTTSPFVIKAIGDENSLAQALIGDNNLSDLHRRQESFGVIFNIEKVKEVTVPAFSGSFDIKYTKAANE